LLVSFEPTSGFQPGNVGQLNIEYNQVRRMTPGKFNRLFSKARSKNLVPVILKNIVQKLEVKLVVLDDQNRRSRRC
jgi:hypothetical protein